MTTPRNWPLIATPDQVAAALRAEMARHGTEQQQIADALGMSQQAVSRRVTGQVPMSVDDITNFATVIGCPISRLLNPLT